MLSFSFLDSEEYYSGAQGWTVEFGITNIATMEPQAHHISRRIIDVVINPNYDRYTITHDNALLKLSAPIEFTDFVRPACLATGLDEGATYQGVCMTAGWGGIAIGEIGK